MANNLAGWALQGKTTVGTVVRRITSRFVPTHALHNDLFSFLWPQYISHGQGRLSTARQDNSWDSCKEDNKPICHYPPSSQWPFHIPGTTVQGSYLTTNTVAGVGYSTILYEVEMQLKIPMKRGEMGLKLNISAATGGRVWTCRIRLGACLNSVFGIVAVND